MAIRARTQPADTSTDKQHRALRRWVLAFLFAAGSATAMGAENGQPMPPLAETEANGTPNTTLGDASAAAPPHHEAPATCLLPRDEELLGLDWARRTSFEGICVTARWLDSWFGDSPFDPNEYPVEGYVDLSLEHRRLTHTNFTPKIRTRLVLPNLSRRAELFFDRDDERTTISGEGDPNDLRKRTGTDTTSNQFGLGYELKRTIDSLLNFRAGLRIVNRQFDPFVRSRYSLNFGQTENTQWRFSETLFWRHQEGFGATSSLSHHAQLSSALSTHWGLDGTQSQTSIGWRWSSGLALLHELGDRQALSYSVGVSGQTGLSDPIENFGPRIAYRRQMGRRWLFGEVYVGQDHLKSTPEATREIIPYAGLRLEAHFIP